MRIYRALEECEDFGPCALAIGNFDGVHAGHRALLERVSEIARQNGWNAAALTFDPHPTKIVAPQRSPRLLTTPEERAVYMSALGIQRVLILPFTMAVARLTPHEFVESIIVEKLRARAVVVGESFRFGAKQAGDTKLLGELGRLHGFTECIVSPVQVRARVVSSSEIRDLLERGDVSMACRLLTRPYALQGHVVPGHGVGSKQTVPTLNLATRAEVLPAMGVYITRTLDAEASRLWRSVTNVGMRPTFGGDALSIETFLLDPLTGPAPREIRVEFLRRLREERKFDSPEALRAQILRDVARSNAYFRRRGIY
jgi:riboflavin kinase/FMN adenylyltransferase